MIRYFALGTMLIGTSIALAQPASAQQHAQEASSEEPNDKAQQDRSFEETRKHMQVHSDWSKQSGKMNDN